MPALADGISIVSAAASLPAVPLSWAHVGHWRGVPLVFDLEVWAAATATVTGLELLGVVAKPATIADDDVDAVVHASDSLTVTAHAYATGDGPVQLTTTGTLPGGLAAATDYWVGVVDANTIKLYASLEDVLSGASAIDITSAGSGTHTISDTDDTQRLRWLSYGLLGHDGDGAVDLDGQRGYATRIEHRPRTLAYALAGTVSAAISAEIYLVRPVRI